MANFVIWPIFLQNWIYSHFITPSVPLILASGATILSESQTWLLWMPHVTRITQVLSFCEFHFRGGLYIRVVVCVNFSLFSKTFCCMTMPHYLYTDTWITSPLLLLCCWGYMCNYIMKVLFLVSPAKLKGNK